MLEIPSPTTVWSKYSLVLEETLYSFEYQWNERDTSWHLSIFDNENKPLAYNIKLLPWVPLLSIYSRSGLPLGEIMVIDLQENFGMGSGRPDRTGFSDRFKLVYVTSSELGS